MMLIAIKYKYKPVMDKLYVLGFLLIPNTHNFFFRLILLLLALGCVYVHGLALTLMLTIRSCAHCLRLGSAILWPIALCVLGILSESTTHNDTHCVFSFRFCIRFPFPVSRAFSLLLCVHKTYKFIHMSFAICLFIRLLDDIWLRVALHFACKL